MDKNYLEHIVGSHHIDEALGNKLAAHGTNIARAVSSLGGGDVESSANTKFKSLYSSYKNKIATILKNFFEGQKGEFEGHRSLVNRINTTFPLQKRQFADDAARIADIDKQIATIAKMRKLYDLIVKGQQPPVDNLRRYDDKKTSQNATYAAGPYKLGESKLMDLLEGFISVGELNAIAKGDTKKIVDAYVAKLKSTHDDFVKTASSMTGYPKDYIGRYLDAIDKAYGKVYTSVGEFLYGPAPVTSTPDAPPVAPTPTTPTPAPTPSTSGGTIPFNCEFQKTANDFIGGIVAKALEVINIEIQNSENTEPYFSKPMYNPDNPDEAPDYYLPTKTEEPRPPDPGWKHDVGDKNLGDNPPRYSVDTDPKTGKPRGYKHLNIPPEPLKEVTPAAAPVPAAATTPDIEDIPDVEEAPTGDFVYDFSGRFRKFPGAYNITVTKGGGVQFKLPSSGKEIIMEVIWKWEKHKNIIGVKMRDVGSNTWSAGDILMFWDDQINPTSPSYAVDIELFLRQIDRRQASFWGAANISAINLVREQVKKFKPALYAVVRHKGVMEFTSRDVPIVLVGKSVMMVTRSDRHMMDTKELDLHTKHEKFEERERWIRKLKHIGYYSANGLTPPDPKEEPVKIPENEKYLLRNLPYALEAMAKLIAANSGLKADFDKIMQKEIDIANTAGSTINPLNASEEEWLILGNKGVQQKISVDTLVKDYSMSEVEATRMVDIASRTLPAKNITADAIIKKVNPTAPTAAAPPTAPTPTPTPPVPAPVTPPAPEEPEVKAELTQAEKIDYLKNIPNCMEAVDILKANGWDVDNALNVVLKTAIEIDVSGASAEDIAGYAGYLVEPTPEAPTPAPMRALSWDKENVDWTKGGKSYKVSQLLSPAFGYPKALVKDMEASGIFKDHPEIKADIENKEAAKKAKKPTASKKKKTEIVNPFQAANFL